ncbi:hypothetical protein B0H67DRAFT_494176 [Lasiosphaeris hirsuta]|uniref:C2H2-type domain-containing protein n=1 Tax=Lasiosphaeris hirsuta TaxID=260670 RepID=A0AA40DRU1_9PEZI|nr:hypothetical protein B0H67DRAFT_494176 [Lasiosphaeris hirsuta]
MKRSREPNEEPPHDPTTPATTISAGGSGIHHTTKYHPVFHNSDDDDSLPPAAKITELDLASGTQKTIDMHCSLPPHKEPQVFATYDEYESHYHKTHTNRCLECRKNFPSAHLLSLHIEEMHDSFAVVKRERGDRTYSCFVEGCDKKCYSPQKRRLHLIDKHMYPKNFFFAVTRDGIDGRRSLLLEGGHRRRRSSVATAGGSAKGHSRNQVSISAAAEKPDASTDSQQRVTDTKPPTPKQKPDVAMDDLAGAMSALQFIPPSIRFGRGGRAGFAKR